MFMRNYKYAVKVIQTKLLSYMYSLQFLNRKRSKHNRDLESHNPTVIQLFDLHFQQHEELL